MTISTCARWESRSSLQRCGTGAPYAILKQVILQRYEINPEASQVKLQQMTLNIDNDIAEHVSRVDALVKRRLIPVYNPDFSDKK